MDSRWTRGFDGLLMVLALGAVVATACSKNQLSPSLACPVVPTSLDFGNVTMGTCSNDVEFIVRNNSAGALSGFVEEACGEFTIIRGEGAFRLNPGQAFTVGLRFCPQSVGAKSCIIETGSGVCSNVTLSGSGNPPVQCQVSDDSLSFGTVTVGSCSATQSFTITNPGAIVVNGSVSESCPDFEITSGGGAYSLGQGQSRVVEVRFCPQSVGPRTCTIETGNAACSDVNLSGTGDASPACEVSPTALAFGNVMVGSCSATQSFTITNSGGGVLGGTVSESCPDFEIASGGGAYALTGGQSRTVVVRFCPQSVGVKNCTVETGDALCSNVDLSGTGDPAPTCDVAPTVMNFGDVTTGLCSTTQDFVIHNPGPEPLTGTVGLGCPDFEITAGGGPYNLGAGQSLTVSVRFCPQGAGPKSCTVETGNPVCSDVQVDGTGQEPSACQVNPTFLEFGLVQVGTCSDTPQSFTITNNGLGILSGSVTEQCPEIVILSGGGPYVLGPGQSVTVTVNFCPLKLATGGERRRFRVRGGPESPQGACVIETGLPECSDVVANGDGF